MGRSFRYLLAATTSSNLADGMLLTGAPLLAITLTRDPTLVSLVGVATTLPWLLLALHAGAVADRADRRRIMVITSFVRAAALAATAAAVAMDVLSLPVLLAILLVAGACEVFNDTSAQSVLPMTVGKESLGRANGRIVAVQTIGNSFVGGPVAALLVGVAPMAVFGAPALLYTAAGLLLLGMRGAFAPAKVSTAPLRADIATGLRYLVRHRPVRDLAIGAGVMNMCSSAYFAVFVLWAVGEGSAIGMTTGQYGVVMAVLAVGAIAGSLLANRLTVVFGEGRTLVTLWTVNSLMLLLPVVSPTLPAVYVTGALLGATSAAGNVLVVSLRQRIIPEELLGRVNSAYRLIGMGGQPLGAALGGVVGGLAGLPVVFVGAVAMCLAVMPLVARALAHKAVPVAV
ncbi:MFS transporter [Nonomuraea africana]|uniref:MFS family permease n=1 Tax=Nonomuraea africana TaxID=46171 RepID=A0ABR9KHE7_9ACTN|nr:MFS transporter [Nonomuraea africana]MBE1561240.1 MFS family permease [Nonomuraea africana]